MHIHHMNIDPVHFLQMSFFSNMINSANPAKFTPPTSQFMQFFLICVFTYMMRVLDAPYYKVYLLEYIKSFLNSGECAITIPTHKRVYRRCYNNIQRPLYSKRFRAINHYLLHHMQNTTAEYQLSELCEIINIEEDNSDADEFILIPCNLNKIRISHSPEIYFENIVHIEETQDGTGNGNGSGNSTNKSVPIKNYVYRISTPGKQNITILQDFIADLEKQYEKNIETTEQMIFEYLETIRSEEDGKPIMSFQAIPFHSNKWIDKNVFFENRDEFLRQIRAFPATPNSDSHAASTSVKSPIELEYEYKGIPYKCAILLHGEPGCGKTSIIKGILNETKRHGIIVQWTRLKTCRDFSALFRQLTINDKSYKLGEVCYIFEDFDANGLQILKERKNKKIPVGKKDELFEIISSNSDPENLCYKDKGMDRDKGIDYTRMDRDKGMDYTRMDRDKGIDYTRMDRDKGDRIVEMCLNMKPDDELTLDYILNMFDGVVELYNAMIIFTTNMPLSTFDSALIRPGRIDLVLEMKKCTVDIIRQMFLYNYRIHCEDESQYDAYFAKMRSCSTFSISPSHVQLILLKHPTDPEDFLQEISDLFIHPEV